MSSLDAIARFVESHGMGTERNACSVVILIETKAPNGTWGITRERVNTMSGARRALGY